VVVGGRVVAVAQLVGSDQGGRVVVAADGDVEVVVVVEEGDVRLLGGRFPPVRDALQKVTVPGGVLPRRIGEVAVDLGSLPGGDAAALEVADLGPRRSRDRERDEREHRHENR
jgi:hypothetical protein